MSKDDERLSQDELDQAMAGASSENPSDESALNNFLETYMAATTESFSTLVNQNLSINAPELKSAAISAVPEPFEGVPKLLAKAIHSGSLDATILMVFQNQDAKKIAHWMLSEPAEAVDDTPLEQVHLEAFTEAVNQVVHANGLALNNLLGASIQVSTPKVSPFEPAIIQDSLDLADTDTVYHVSYEFKSDEGPAFKLVLILPSATMSQIKKLISPLHATSKGFSTPPPSPNLSESSVKVQPVQFSPFDHQASLSAEQCKNLELMYDVSLNLSVELGQTELALKEVLELTRGSIIEIDRLAGEPVDLLVNGKLIARGEVVVIEDNFGLRITTIVSPSDRLKSLT
jgi:flagellar motor switch protein FliN